MQHQEGFFKGVREANIYYQCWLPEGDPKAVLLIVHGLAEHSGRYVNVVDHFAPLGYAIYGLDHLGHGRSEGDRVYVDRFTDYTDTLDTFVDMVKGWQPGKPIFLVGHSMGGLISATYLLEHQDKLAGAVLSGAAAKIPDTMSPTTLTLGKVFSTLMPKFRLMALDAGGVSRDPAVVDAYVNDPLVFTGKTTARLAAELLAAMQQLGTDAGKINLPLLILQGSEDKLVDPEGAPMLYEAVSSADKTIHIYEGLYHEVYNEPERDQVLGDVASWLTTQLAKS